MSCFTDHHKYHAQTFIFKTGLHFPIYGCVQKEGLHGPCRLLFFISQPCETPSLYRVRNR